MRSGEKEAGSGHPEGMAKRDGAAVWIYSGIVVGDAELAEAGERLRGECFVELDDVHLIERESWLSASAFRDDGTGPIPMIRGSTPATAEETIRAIGSRLCFLTASSDAMRSAAAPSLMPEELPAVTDPFVVGMRLEFRQHFECRVGANELVFGESFRLLAFLFAGIVTGAISRSNRPAFLRSRGLHLGIAAKMS